MLDEVDYKILSALGRNPLARIKDLSKELGINVKTLSKRFQQLIENKVLYTVSAQICPPALGLEPIILFIDAKVGNIPILEKVADFHPYTRYRVRCLGSLNGLMTIFAIPKDGMVYLMELFDKLHEIGIVNKYVFLNTVAKWVYKEVDFTYYDVKNDVWAFDWGKWRENIERISVTRLENYPSSVLHKMEEKDMAILKELSINAREKLKNLSTKLKIPEYHLSRRIKFYLDNNVIEGFRLSIYTKASRIFDQFIFKCKCPINITIKFANAMKTLPFPYTFIPIQDGFILTLLISPEEMYELSRTIEKYVEEIEFIWAEYRTGGRYPFYGEPFKNGKWQIDRKMLIDNILSKINIK